MVMDITLGINQKNLLKLLKEKWLPDGPPVFFLSGFPGTGKTELAEALSYAGKEQKYVPIRIRMPEPTEEQVPLFLLEAAIAFEEAGLPDLAMDLNRAETTPDQMRVFPKVFTGSRLVVVDEFQRCFERPGAKPHGLFQKMLSGVSQSIVPGRLLLVSSKKLEMEKWNERIRTGELESFETGEAIFFLRTLLTERKMMDSIPGDKLLGVVRALGCNPRALKALVSVLEVAGFDDIVGEERSLWDLQERKFSSELLEKLEETLLERTLRVLEANNPDYFQMLGLLCIYRKSVKAEGFRGLEIGKEEHVRIRSELVRRFLVDQKNGWYEANTIVRKLVPPKLTEQNKIQYHQVASTYYTRHFTAKSPGGGESQRQDNLALGSHFIEARYHLYNARRSDELAPIARAFEGYLRRIITTVTPPPQQADELEERIALLEGYLKEPGPKAFEYHLARCYVARNKEGDAARALEFCRRAIGPKAPADTWVLLIKLEYECNGIEETVKAFRRGAGVVSPTQNLFALYQSCGELMAREGRAEEAIELLKEGIDHIPPTQSLYALYQSCGELMAREGRAEEAIELLKEGIDRIPPTQSLFALFSKLSGIYLYRGEEQNALDALTDGLTATTSNQATFLVLKRQLVVILHILARDKELTDIQKANKTNERDVCNQLAELFLRLLEQNWEGALGIAERNLAASALPDFHYQRIFSLLCASRHGEALPALGAIPERFQGDGTIFHWLAALTHALCGDTQKARVHLERYTLAPLNAAAVADRNALLHLWDEDAGNLKSNPAFYFPHLPPSLTGLSHVITRKQDATRVWPITQDVSRTPSASLPEPPVPCVLAVATEWNSRHGGLSTFNRELCKALARTGARVACLVMESDAQEETQAASAGVTLIKAKKVQGRQPDLALPLNISDLPEGFAPTIIIGHDRTTGSQALYHKTNYYPSARFALFIHTAPEEIELHKSGRTSGSITKRGEERSKEQLDIAEQADVVFAVGPRLTKEFKSNLRGIKNSPPLHEFLPGMGELQEPPSEEHQQIHCLLMGRAEDFELKGLDIAGKAWALLKNKLDSERLALPILVIRGAEPGKGDEVLEKVLLSAGGGLLKEDIRIKEYTTETETLEQDLRRATFMLMPSRVEGFGLVGLEALAMSRQVIMSDRSGLGEYLRANFHDASSPFVFTRTGNDEEDAETIANKAKAVIEDQRGAFERAKKLRNKLTSTLNWDSSAQSFLDKVANLEQ
ncbi:MAG: glycosyltransferase [Desulfovibrio sp.]